MSLPVQLPHFQQSSPGSCLPACIRMVLASLGIERSEDEVGRIIGAREFGAPSFAVMRLEALKLKIEYRQWSIGALLEQLRLNRPLIVFVRTAFLDYWADDVAHAVVVVGAAEGKLFWVHDPILPTGPNSVSWHGLLASWAEFSYRGATISLR